jgi:hypothetical protein
MQMFTRTRGASPLRASETSLAETANRSAHIQIVQCSTKEPAGEPPSPIPIQPDDHTDHLTHYCIHPDGTTSLEAPGFPDDLIFEFD